LEDNVQLEDAIVRVENLFKSASILPFEEVSIPADLLSRYSFHGLYPSQHFFLLDVEKGCKEL
jgi:hypothetical protein